MAHRISWTPDARNQFREEIKYLQGEEHALGTGFRAEVLERIRSLRDYPELGRMVPELGRPDIRELIVHFGHYRLVYRLRPNEVQIVLVFHTRRHPRRFRKALEGL